MPSKDSALTAEEMLEAPGSGKFFERLPEKVVNTLSAEQKEAIHQAAQASSWGKSPVDIRFTLPFFGRNFYVTIVGGREKRDHQRRAQDRTKYPLRTIANGFFFVGLATIFYVLAMFVLALQSAIIEF